MRQDLNAPATDFWETAKAAGIAQAKALKEQAGKGGLRFEAYLPPGLAAWVLELIARGDFTDPSEAVFVMLTEQHDLEPHADLRQELLSRTVQTAIDDPRPPLPAEEVWEELRRRVELRHDPALWTGTAGSGEPVP